MKAFFPALLLATSLSSPAWADMPVVMLLQKVDAAQSGKDPRARALVRNELAMAERQWRTRFASGQIRDVCLDGQRPIHQDKIIQHFRSLNPQQRAMTPVSAAFHGAMKRAYPCGW